MHVSIILLNIINQPGNDKFKTTSIDSCLHLEIEYIHSHSKVPAYLNVVDIAGLVKGAAEGQGLGNAFLSHISACDAIFHLCSMFIVYHLHFHPKFLYN